MLAMTKSCLDLLDEYMRQEDKLPISEFSRKHYQMEDVKVQFLTWSEHMNVFGAPGRSIDARLRERPDGQESLVDGIKTLTEHIKEGSARPSLRPHHLP